MFPTVLFKAYFVKDYERVSNIAALVFRRRKDRASRSPGHVGFGSETERLLSGGAAPFRNFILLCC